MVRIPKKIGITGIDEQCFQIMLPYIMGIRFLQPEKIIVRDIQLIGPVSFPDVFLQRLHAPSEALMQHELEIL